MPRNDKDRAFPAAYSRRVGEAFVRIDACLTDALHYLQPVVQQSPFPSRVADAVPVQHQLMLNELELIRAAMKTISARHRISLPAPSTSAIESCRLRISEAMLALSELDPRTANAASSMASAQGLSEDVEEDACRLVGHLMALLDALQSSLSRDIDMGAQPERPVALPASGGPQYASSNAPPHPLVAELERITMAHGLGVLHRRSMDFARHYGSGDIVVGLFGAVSAGKSSLLNSLLGSALLPVAALPTTAMPVEIRHGKVERGTVEFVAARTEFIDRARIAEFVDAHSNPENVKGVTRIAFETPASLLSGGITLIDTPGIDWEEWGPCTRQPADRTLVRYRGRAHFRGCAAHVARGRARAAALQPWRTRCRARHEDRSRGRRRPVANLRARRARPLEKHLSRRSRLSGQHAGGRPAVATRLDRRALC